MDTFMVQHHIPPLISLGILKIELKCAKHLKALQYDNKKQDTTEHNKQRLKSQPKTIHSKTNTVIFQFQWISISLPQLPAAIDR